MDALVKKYTCECGKAYTNSQAFNGHKSSCKIHLASLGKVVSSGLTNVESRAKSSATRSANQAKKREQQELQWRAEQHVCERCGKVMTEKYASGRFCSQACSNQRTQSAKTRAKISQGVKQSFTRLNELRFDQNKKLSQYKMSKKTMTRLITAMDLPCSCCGAYVSGIQWDLHHITPRSQGGSDYADNLTYICPNCHRICHTNISLLPKNLISLDDFFESLDGCWQDYCSIISLKER